MLCNDLISAQIIDHVKHFPVFQLCECLFVCENRKLKQFICDLSANKSQNIVHMRSMATNSKKKEEEEIVEMLK